jgi:hypothetical protein
MNINEIERLIGKYYEGNTTLDEERTLREFFRAGNVPPHISEHRALFGFFSNARTEKIPSSGLGKNLDAVLEDAAIIPIHRSPGTRFYLAAVAAAAVLLLCIGLTFLYTSDRSFGYSDKDRLAYAQAKEALFMVSSGLNTGLQGIGDLSAFSKGVDKARMLSEFNTYQNIIMNPDGSPNQSTTSK